MRNPNWKYYSPVFESDSLNPAMIMFSPWVGHRRFIYDLTRYLEPDRIVELGSYYGCSAFAFLQAVKDGELKTNFHAVDTWEGDSYTINDYREDIYGAYKEIQDACFSGQNSFMHKMTFDEAADRFSDHSISILHIDGSHLYEDVKHDFEIWEKKVKEDGIIVFHDTGKDLLYGEVMGSSVFWEEIKSQRPFTFEFPFSNGLGLLFMGREIYEKVFEQFDPAIYAEYIFLQDTVNKDIIRKNYFEIRDLQKEIHRIADEKGKLNEFAFSKEAYIADLKGQIDKLKKYADEKERYNCELENNLKKEKAFADEKEQYCLKLVTDLNSINSFLDEKEKYIADLEGKLSTLNDFVLKKEEYIAVLGKEICELKTYADGKAGYNEELEKQLADLKAYADGKAHYSEELEKQLADLKAYADGKAHYSEELEKQLADLKAYADGKAHYSEELEKQLADLKVYADGKAHYSEELEKQLADLKTYADGKAEYCHELQEALNIQTSKMNEIKEEADRYQEKVLETNRLIKELPFGQMILKHLEKKTS